MNKQNIVIFSVFGTLAVIIIALGAFRLTKGADLFEFGKSSGKKADLTITLPRTAADTIRQSETYTGSGGSSGNYCTVSMVTSSDFRVLASITPKTCGDKPNDGIAPSQGTAEIALQKLSKQANYEESTTRDGRKVIFIDAPVYVCTNGCQRYTEPVAVLSVSLSNTSNDAPEAYVILTSTKNNFSSKEVLTSAAFRKAVKGATVTLE